MKMAELYGGFLDDFVAAEEVGRSGMVKHVDGRNVFDPR
jgi:hypothetical protein